MSESDNILTLKTVQITPFRTLMSALKDIILQPNIMFDATGMHIIDMDKSHTIVACLNLYAHKFEIYECKPQKIIIGVVMTQLFKLINTIENDDILTIYIEKDEYCDGIVKCLTIKFENGIKKQYKIQKLKLTEPDPEEIRFAPINYSSIINLPSADFQKIIRDAIVASDKIEICSVGHELIFKCSGHFADMRLVRSESDNGMEIMNKQDSSKIVSGEFSLKNLSYFIKCTNLCLQIEMYLDNDMPLVIKYDVADLGDIKLGLAPLPPSFHDNV